MASLGDAYIEVHADTGPFDRELAASIEKALIKAEAAMRARGRDAGNAFSEGVERAVKDRTDKIGTDLGDGLVKSAEKTGKRIKTALGDALKDTGKLLIPDLDEGDLDRKGNAFTRLGAAISNAFSSASDTVNSFVSTVSKAGTSMSTLLNPGVLVPVAGLIIGAITGLGSAVSALGALILAIPAGLSLVGAAAFTLFAVFSGLGDRIKAAFNAKDADELRAAIENLAPATAKFVASFQKVGDLWRDIQKIAQKNFFGQIGSDLGKLVDKLKPSIIAGVGKLATSLGKFADGLIKIFGSPEFKSLVDKTFPAISRIVDKLKEPTGAFLKSVFKLAEAALPFVEKLATKFGEFLTMLSGKINAAEEDGSLKKFFDDAYTSLGYVWEIGKQVFAVIQALISAATDESHGDFFLATIADSLKELAFFLKSDGGQKALKQMIELAAGAIKLIEYLVIAIFIAWSYFTAAVDGFKATFIAVVEWFNDFPAWWDDLWMGIGLTLRSWGDGIATWWDDLWMGIGLAIRQFLDYAAAKWKSTWDTVFGFFSNQWNTHIQWIKDRWNEFISWFSGGILGVRTAISNGFAVVSTYLSIWYTGLRIGFNNAWNNVVATARGIGGRIKSAVGSLGDILYNAGKNVVQGLINGIKAATPSLTNVLAGLTNLIPKIKGPESVDKKLLEPAGIAIMSGLQVGIRKGAAGVLGDLASLTGMIGMTANANAYNFGPGAIVQNFNGAQPSTSAASQLGSAVGAGIANTVNQQNMRASTRAI